MREFTEQFFDLLLDLDGNWRVTTVRSNNMEEAVKLFCNWGAYVLGSNIKEMIKVAKMLNNHLKGVCNAIVESFSNAMAERLIGKNPRN